jgi:hypothetical protein
MYMIIRVDSITVTKHADTDTAGIVTNIGLIEINIFADFPIIGKSQVIDR